MTGNNIKMLAKKTKRIVGNIVRPKSRGSSSKQNKDRINDSGIGPPSLYHALVVIFLEFFAWGLMTSPIISILHETFPNQTFLMNGLIQGVKGMMSFLAAPLLGALSDIWGRKIFLLLSVSFTCCPIPFMKISPWWYFAMISLSGVFAITFSIVFAYVADVTPEEERTSAYGLVSATFAASLVTSPSIGAYLESVYSDNFVIWLATAIAVLDVFFILVFVPESLPEKSSRETRHISWENADPFSALRKMGSDKLIMLLCLTVFLSYLPEAGEYSCFFVYLRLVMQFTSESVASFIAVVGILSVISQTMVLGLLMKYLGHKQAIMYGLVFEFIQLSIYGFCTQTWLIWTAGAVAAMSSLTYPAISAFVSEHAQADEQGVAQGVVTGVRSLCYGLGPALFGVIFYLFDINLNKPESSKALAVPTNASLHHDVNALQKMIPGPPFAFGTILVLLALLVAAFIPDNPHSNIGKNTRRVSNQDSGDKKCEVVPLMVENEEIL